ncbi:hypothetical protein [Falsibacillus pallidus]|uniref:Putative dehydrogenase n=1 Tax=Falsibacillus pallidus TaxID=493781 RepID=A0A370G890_9BACI|nr:hypothetical protein [Falsibacillus pallidus]RDI40008.1 putative dehydrogenase [Falsibacillus pallidus]
MKIGIIGSDSSHVIAFTREILNCGSNIGHKIAAVYPYYSPQIASSMKQHHIIMERFLKEFPIPIADSLEELNDRCDAYLLLSMFSPDRKKIWEQLKGFGKPVFIDKPLSLSTEEAHQYFMDSKEGRTPLMSSSALRYANFIQRFQNEYSPDEIVELELEGPLDFAPHYPGYFWYGIHLVEMMQGIMKTLPVSISVKKSGQGELVECIMVDGKKAVIKGIQEGKSVYRITAKTKNEAFPVIWESDPQESMYSGLIQEILSFFKTGRNPIPIEETLSIIHVIERINRCRDNSQRAL